MEYHARIITETAIKRELIRISSEIQRDAFEDTTDVFKLLDDTESALFEVSESNIRKNFDDMRSLMGKAIKELEEKKNQKRRPDRRAHRLHGPGPRHERLATL